MPQSGEVILASHVPCRFSIVRAQRQNLRAYQPDGRITVITAVSAPNCHDYIPV